MGVYKKEICKACGWNGIESSPKKTGGTCKKCGASTNYSQNWSYSFKHNGKKITKAVSPDKRFTEDALAKVKVGIRENKHFDKAPSTPWDKAVMQFREWMVVNVTPNTKRAYDTSLKHLGTSFSVYSLDQISIGMVEQFKNARAVNSKAATVNMSIGVLKRLFSLCEDWELVQNNPMRKVKFLKMNNQRTRFLTGEETTNLLAHCRNKKVLMAMQIALNTGLRKDGALSLRWQEIDFQRNMINKRVKGGRSVTIPLSRTLKGLLLDYKRSLKVLSPFILSGRKPENHLTGIEYALQAAKRGAGITDFSFHDLRHTFASHFLMRTRDLKALQEILGHSKIEMTMRYAHLLKEHLTEAMEIFDAGDPCNYQTKAEGKVTP